MPLASRSWLEASRESRGAQHTVWGAPEISSSSECESGSETLRSSDKARSNSHGSRGSRSSRRRELEGAQRQFHALASRLPGSEEGRRHRVMSSSASNDTSTSNESHSPSFRRDRKDLASPKAEWDVFYRKMKELSKASRESEVPADRPRAWDPTAPIEELKKLLEEDFEGVCAFLEDPERAEAAEAEAEAETESEDPEAIEGEGEWSVGSEGHAQGQCRPCHYVFAKTGCQNGRECNFCHLPHPKRFRPRPCKSKRFKCKQLAAVLDQVLDDDPDSFQNVVEQLSSQGGYLNTVVKSKLRSMAKRSARSEARGSDSRSDLPSQPCGVAAMEAKRVLKPGLVSL